MGFRVVVVRGLHTPKRICTSLGSVCGFAGGFGFIEALVASVEFWGSLRLSARGLVSLGLSIYALARSFLKKRADGSLLCNPYPQVTLSFSTRVTRVPGKVVLRFEAFGCLAVRCLRCLGLCRLKIICWHMDLCRKLLAKETSMRVETFVVARGSDSLMQAQLSQGELLTRAVFLHGVSASCALCSGSSPDRQVRKGP